MVSTVQGLAISERCCGWWWGSRCRALGSAHGLSWSAGRKDLGYREASALALAVEAAEAW